MFFSCGDRPPTPNPPPPQPDRPLPLHRAAHCVNQSTPVFRGRCWHRVYRAIWLGCSWQFTDWFLSRSIKGQNHLAIQAYQARYGIVEDSILHLFKSTPLASMKCLTERSVLSGSGVGPITTRSINFPRFGISNSQYDL